jgi:hypothetical protein
MLAGLIVAGLAFILVTPLWEASALIQIGQVSGSTGPSGVTQIEPSDVVAMKMMRPAFIKASVQRAGRPDLYKCLLPLNIRVNKAGTLVVQIWATTPDIARQLMGGVVAEIVEEHNQLMEPRLHYAKETFAQLQKELEQKNEEAIRVNQKISKLEADVNGENNNSTLLMPWLIRDSLVSQDRHLALLVNDALTEPDTHPTRAVGEIEVSDQPAFPRPPQFIALGLVLGAAFAAALLWMVKGCGSPFVEA